MFAHITVVLNHKNAITTHMMRFHLAVEQYSDVLPLDHAINLVDKCCWADLLVIDVRCLLQSEVRVREVTEVYKQTCIVPATFFLGITTTNLHLLNRPQVDIPALEHSGSLRIRYLACHLWSDSKSCRLNYRSMSSS